MEYADATPRVRGLTRQERGDRQGGLPRAEPVPRGARRFTLGPAFRPRAPLSCA